MKDVYRQYLALVEFVALGRDFNPKISLLIDLLHEKIDAEEE